MNDQNALIVLGVLLVIILIMLFMNRKEGFEGFEGNSWTQIPGTLKNLSVSNNTLCGVNNANELWCTSDVNNPSWKRLTGNRYNNVSVSGNSICVATGKNNDVWCADDNKNPIWHTANKQFIDISLQPNHLCGIDLENKIYCASNEIWKNPTPVRQSGLMALVNPNPPPDYIPDVYSTGNPQTIFYKTFY